MLGQGYSSNPVNLERTLEDISSEIKEIINSISVNDKIPVLNVLSNLNIDLYRTNSNPYFNKRSIEII